MDADLISFESMLATKNAAEWAYWTMIGGFATAAFTLITTCVATYAAIIAFKTLHSWKEQEKQKQLVRLKRAVFSYREKIESIYKSSAEDNHKAFFNNDVSQALTEIFHELLLAGFEGTDRVEEALFNELFRVHSLYSQGEVRLQEVFFAVIELQKSVKVELAVC